MEIAEAGLRITGGYGSSPGGSSQFSLTMPWMWFNLAAAQGNESAKKNRDIAASHMTRDQLAQAQRLAREWRSASER
jgi:hypothetical protein